MRIEKTPEGRKVAYEVETAEDGAVKRGTFDEFSQRRLATKNSYPNGETTITYDLAGKTENIVAGDIETPRVAKSFIDTSKHGHKVLTEEMSDGSRVVTDINQWQDGYDSDIKTCTRIVKTDKAENITEQIFKTEHEFNNYDIVGEYEDAGKSGKSTEGRTALTRRIVIISG